MLSFVLLDTDMLLDAHVGTYQKMLKQVGDKLERFAV